MYFEYSVPFEFCEFIPTVSISSAISGNENIITVDYFPYQNFSLFALGSNRKAYTHAEFLFK